MAISLRESAAIRIARGPIVLCQPVLTNTSIFTGESSEFVVRLDKRSHKEVWRKRKMAWVRSAHDDNILVYAGQTKETQLWNQSGTILWKRRGSLTAKKGRVFLNDGGLLQVIDVMTGEAVDEFACPSGTASLMHDGVLLLRNADGTTDPIQAVNLAGRTAVWRKHLIPEITERYGDDCPRGLSFLASLAGQVVAKTGRHLVALSLADGALGWGLPVSVPYVTMVQGGRIYAWSAPPVSATTRVTLDLDSGQVTRERSAPSGSENRLVIVDEANGEIVVDRPLAPHGAAFRRAQEAHGGTICKHHVVFTSSSSLMAVFRLSDGELVWQHEHRDQLFSPVFEDNRLYAACADGTIVIFEAEGDEL